MEGQLVGWMETAATRTAELPALDTTDAITAIAAEYSTMLYRVAYSVCRNASDAEDAVQETFVRVLKNRDKLAEIRDLRVWLIRITWNVVLDRKRRTKVRPETEDIADVEHKLQADCPGAEDSLISVASVPADSAADRPPPEERAGVPATLGHRGVLHRADCRRSRGDRVVCPVKDLPGPPRIGCIVAGRRAGAMKHAEAQIDAALAAVGPRTACRRLGAENRCAAQRRVLAPGRTSFSVSLSVIVSP